MLNRYHIIYFRLLSFIFFAFINIRSGYGQYFSSLNFGTNEGLPSTQIYDIWKDSLGYMWFSTDRGVSRFDGRNFKSFYLQDGLACGSNFRIFPSGKNSFWVNGINGKLSYWNGKHFQKFKFNDKIAFLNKNEFSSWNTILNQENNILSFFTNHNELDCLSSYYKIDISSGKLDSIKCTETPVLGKQISNYTRYRLSKCSNKKDKKQRLIDSLVSATSKLNDITLAYSDSHSNYWIGTYSGLYYYQVKKNIISEVIKDVPISMIYEVPNEGFWVATLNDGVYYISNLAIKKLRISNNNQIVSHLNIFKDSLYIKCENEVIFQIVKKDSISFTTKIITKNHPYQFKKYVEIFSTLKLTNNRIIKYSSLGFGYIDSLSDRFLCEYNERALCCAEDAQKTVWVGTINGLYKSSINQNSNLFVKQKIPFLDKDIRINHIVTAKNHIWLATISQGLIFKKDEKYQLIKDKRLLSNVVHSLLLENDSTLWVATNQGLNKIIYYLEGDSPLIKRVSSFNKTTGLLSDFILDIEMWNGMMFLATNKGVCYFNPDSLKLSTSQPHVFIQNVIANDSIIEDNTNLSFNQNNIEITFGGVSVQRLPLNKKQFRFRINGLQWIYTRKSGAHFTNLKPNRYKFEVQFRDLNNVWSKTSFFNFTIQPHYSQTLWFKFLILFFLGVALFYFIRRREKRLINKSKIEVKYREIELSTLRSQLNPHFIFNSLNTLQSFVFSNKQERTNKYLGQFSHVIRLGLEYSKKELIKLDAEIAYIETYFELEKERFTNRFEHKIELIGDIDKMSISIPPLLVQPLVENAIKHAFQKNKNVGQIIVSFEVVSEKLLSIIVKDNGQGFDSSKIEGSKKYTSLGLNILKNRIQLLNEKYLATNGSLTIQSKIGHGTTVKLLIPFVKDTFAKDIKCEACS